MDLSTAKVGDKIVMEFTVTGTENYAIEAVQPDYVSGPESIRYFNKNRPCISITSPSKEIKVGLKFSFQLYSKECEIKAIDGDDIWLKFSNGSHSTYRKSRIEEVLKEEFNK